MVFQKKKLLSMSTKKAREEEDEEGKAFLGHQLISCLRFFSQELKGNKSQEKAVNNNKNYRENSQ